ncbi:MAG: hypothetical protein IBJ02_04660 [Brevundimonas sp.]|nr:hypothetical protein [Brevundimonas sp.]
MTKPVRIRLHRSVLIDLPDFDVGDLGPVEHALLGLGAEKLSSVGEPWEETRRYCLGGCEIILDWDGYTSGLRTTDPAQLAALFKALSQSPLFEGAEQNS